jgi:hypothetical protein
VGNAVLLLVLIVGRGRVGFDTPTGPLADASLDGNVGVCLMPAGHDDDADGIDDACDGCPHVPDPLQPDSDDDGVDDACDPRPTTQGDSIAFFDPFVAMDASWIRSGVAVTYANDAVYADTRGAGNIMQLRRPRSAPQATYIIGGTFGAGDTGSSRQILISAHTAGAAYYYCELQGVAPDGKVGATSTLDGATFDVLGYASGPALENGDFTLAFSDSYPAMACDTTWPVTDPRGHRRRLDRGDPDPCRHAAPRGHAALLRRDSLELRLPPVRAL